MFLGSWRMVLDQRARGLINLCCAIFLSCSFLKSLRIF
ncbi:hypothetical protein D1BOALGB6SA_5310 [Olavius sp. associated proteobacterium Delta 1]|nr:hypothetical protein D1BOALGB6SA_5310 [Olavius sp. associated proteobacterium Delta 1]